MTEIPAIGFGIGVTAAAVLLAWWVVSAVFRAAGLRDDAAPAGVPGELWDVLRTSGSAAAGTWLGMLERTVGAVAVWVASPPLIAGWFAFKVASKWQTWSGVMKLPDSLPGVEPVTWLRARRIWASNLLMRFLIGSLVNILLGALAGALGRLAANYAATVG